MTGELGILNVGAGDTKLSFDPADPAEVARASAIVKDMIKRGFCILVEVGKDDKGPTYRRAKAFDEKTAEYIIAGTPVDETVNFKLEKTREYKPQAAPRQRRQATSSRISASKTNAIAVARTAGG